MSAATTTTTVLVAAPAAFSASATPAMVFDPNNMLGLSMGPGPAVSAPAVPATNLSPARAWTVKDDDEPLDILPLAWKRDLSVPSEFHRSRWAPEPVEESPPAPIIIFVSGPVTGLSIWLNTSALKNIPPQSVAHASSGGAGSA